MDKELIEKFHAACTEFIAQNNKYFCDTEKESSSKNEETITPSQNNLLYYLYTYGEATSGKLAEYDSSSKFFISNNVKELFKKGLINRYQKSDNLRYVYIALTDKGREYFENRRNKVISKINSFLSGIATEEDVHKMIEKLHFLSSILKR